MGEEAEGAAVPEAEALFVVTLNGPAARSDVVAGIEGVREALALAGIGAYEQGGGLPPTQNRPYRPGFLSALSSSPGRSTAATTNHNSFPPTADGSLRTTTSTSTSNTGGGGGGGGGDRERRKSVKFTGVGQERASR